MSVDTCNCCRLLRFVLFFLSSKGPAVLLIPPPTQKPKQHSARRAAIASCPYFRLWCGRSKKGISCAQKSTHSGTPVALPYGWLGGSDQSGRRAHTPPRRGRAACRLQAQQKGPPGHTGGSYRGCSAVGGGTAGRGLVIAAANSKVLLKGVWGVPGRPPRLGAINTHVPCAVCVAGMAHGGC